MKTKFIAVAAFVTLLVGCGKDEDTTLIIPSVTSGFEDVAVSSMGYYNGSDLKGDFVSESVTYQNEFTKSTWGDYWSKGFAVSNVNNIDSAGSGNQYATYAGTGANSTVNYSIAQNGAKLTLPDGAKIQSIQITNSTYAALSMQNGDNFAKKFGTVVKDTAGTVTDDGQDWFLLTVNGYDSVTDSTSNGKVEYYLADFRAGKTLIQKEWTPLNLTTLSGSKCLRFTLTSSDNSAWGMNTPGYFAIDEITYIK